MSEATRSIPYQRCSATRKDGEPCAAPVSRDDLCFAHHPELQRKAAEARRKGGQNKSHNARASKLVPSELKPVFDLLLRSLVETYNGQLEPRRAQAMSSLSGALVRVMAAGELEERVRELESRLNEPRQENGLGIS